MIRDVAREARTELDSILGLVAILDEDLATEFPNAGSDLTKIKDASTRVMELVAVLEDQVDSARDLAGRDPLTGIPNRRTLMAHADALFRSETPLSVLVIDVDRFKDVNDRYGHLVGDEVLKIVVDRCRGAVRDSDLVARFAGDEFVILLPESGSFEAHRVAGRVIQQITGSAFATSKGLVPVTVSVGVATREDDGSMEALMARADAAMYSAKQVGGARASRHD